MRTNGRMRARPLRFPHTTHLVLAPPPAFKLAKEDAMPAPRAAQHRAAAATCVAARAVTRTQRAAAARRWARRTARAAAVGADGDDTPSKLRGLAAEPGPETRGACGVNVSDDSLILFFVLPGCLRAHV